MSTLRIPSKIIDMITRQMRASTNNHYKQVLRALLNTFGNLYYIDGNGAKQKIKCGTGRMERNKGKDYQDNTLVLPYISVFERGSSNDDDRRRYTPILVNEVEWDAEEQRAKRYLSLAPRPVVIDYDINIWTKFVEDMDIIRSTILSMFNPDLEIETEDNDYIKAFLVSEDDIDSEESNDKEDRVIKKRITISVETYIRSPKILYTNTSQINSQNYEISIQGEGRQRGRGNRSLRTLIELGNITLLLSNSISVDSTQPRQVDLGNIDLSLSSALIGSSTYTPSAYEVNAGNEEVVLSTDISTSAYIAYNVDIGNEEVVLSSDLTVSSNYLYQVNIGNEELLLESSLEGSAAYSYQTYSVDMGENELILSDELDTTYGIVIDLSDVEDLNNQLPWPDGPIENLYPLDLALSSELSFTYDQDIYVDLNDPAPSGPVSDYFELNLSDMSALDTATPDEDFDA